MTQRNCRFTRVTPNNSHHIAAINLSNHTANTQSRLRYTPTVSNSIISRLVFIHLQACKMLHSRSRVHVLKHPLIIRQKCPRCTKHAMASPASLPLLVPCNCQLSPRPCRLGAHDQTPGAKMPPSSALRFARPPPSLVFGTPLWSGPMRAPAGTSAGLFVCRSTG